MSNTQNQLQILANESDNVSEGQEDQPNYFDTLPDEIHLEILKKVPQLELDSLGLVCRRFDRIIADRSLWKKTKVRGPRELKPGYIKKLMKLQVQHLSLSYVVIPSLWSVFEGTQPSWCLKEVYLYEVITDPNDLFEIFNKCKQLTTVDLSYTAMNTNVFVALSGNKNIEILRLRLLQGVTPVGLEIMLQDLRKLEELWIDFYGSRMRLNEPLIDSICNNLPASLLHLTLCYCFDSLTDRHVAQIVRKCPLLRSFRVLSGNALTARSTELLSNLKHLRILKLPNSPLIPPEAYVPLTNEMENLVELNVVDFLGNDRFRMRRFEELFSVNIIEYHGCYRIGTFKTRFHVVKIKY